MNEKDLLRWSIVIAILGICVLFVLAQEIDVDRISIDAITNEFIDQKVTVAGTVVSVTQLDDMTLFDVQGVDSVSSILVVVFEQMNISIKEGVVVSGTVAEYQGTLEIVADRVERDYSNGHK